MSEFIIRFCEVLFLFSWTSVENFFIQHINMSVPLTEITYILFHIAFWFFVALSFNFFYRLLKFIFNFFFRS